MSAAEPTPEQVAELFASLDLLVALGYLDSYRETDAAGGMEIKLAPWLAAAAREGRCDGLVQLTDAIRAAREATS